VSQDISAAATTRWRNEAPHPADDREEDGMRFAKAKALATGLVFSAAAACGSGSGNGNGNGNGSGLEIAGVYASNFGSEEVITEGAFNGTPIRFFDNEENVLITQNPPDSNMNPDTFNRIVWTEPSGDVFYYCFVDFGLATLEEARNSTATADDTDPENSGCGMFAWTRLREAISFRGSYMNNFDGMETVTATVWDQGGSVMRLVDWNEDENWVVTQNPSDAMSNPDLFNRIEFTEPDPATGSLYYCFVDFGLDTAEDARQSTATADASEPEDGGCGMFPWTRLDPR
jgi:hypothetical protein